MRGGRIQQQMRRELTCLGFQSVALWHTLNRMFGGTVGRSTGNGQQSLDTANPNNGALSLLYHARYNCLGQCRSCQEIDLHHFFIHINGRIDKIRSTGNPTIVDEHVNASGRGQRLFGQLRHGFLVGQVGEYDLDGQVRSGGQRLALCLDLFQFDLFSGRENQRRDTALRQL